MYISYGDTLNRGITYKSLTQLDVWVQSSFGPSPSPLTSNETLGLELIPLNELIKQYWCASKRTVEAKNIALHTPLKLLYKNGGVCLNFMTHLVR